MKIQYCSDLHLEFPANQKYLQENPIKPTGDILMLAGDIVPFAAMEKADNFFNFVSDSFEHVYWIPGNHEYYRADISQRTGSFHERIRSNVSLLNNTLIVHGGVRLLFSTLWSRIDFSKELIIRKAMADFRLIRNKGNKISVDDYNWLHEECLAFLSNELALSTEQKTIVVTHHLPTFVNYPEKYRFSELNSAFATELYELIELSKAAYWIFGHNHEVVQDFKIAETTLTSNQLGYVEYGEHLKFSVDKMI
ncbi:metallophosphoesterase [Chryseolinea sp. T2]|uniref:metallophosphoesterase n=1 Tax=Chryseolinea sp. T2 TaxID=3129255 RepID=UPI0030772DDC